MPAHGVAILALHQEFARIQYGDDHYRAVVLDVFPRCGVAVVQPDAVALHPQQLALEHGFARKLRLGQVGVLHGAALRYKLISSRSFIAAERAASAKSGPLPA